jgi:hypothetical protein
MTSPRMPAEAGNWGVRRLAGSALLILVALGVMDRPGRTQDADPFAATVAVDATGGTVAQARDGARADGQRRALAAVAERLAAGNSRYRLPKLDDNAITALVTSFEVANERMSTVRYAADYTFHFRPEETRRALGNPVPGNPAASTPPPGTPEDTAKRAVLIPVYQSVGAARLWDDPNPWRLAWEEQPAGGAVRLVVPLGDAGDIAALDAEKARSGDSAALTAIARRNGSDEAVVIFAALHGPPAHPTGVDVTARRYRAGQPIASQAEKLSANSGENEDDLLRRAAAAIAGDIAGGWKNDAGAQNDQEGTLTATLQIADLDDWLHARDRLATLPAIRKVSLMALSRQEATIEIAYGGSIDQLKSALAEISLDLVHGDKLWRLAHTGSARQP